MPPAGRPAARAVTARGRRHRRHRRARFLARVALVFVLAGTVGTGTFVAGLLAAPIDLAVVPPPTAVLLLAADGRQFATLQPAQRYEDVRPEDIPQVMRDAIISAEDERFLSHSGVDALATVRAAFRDLSGGQVAQGGSTLTQQYVKNAFLTRERTAVRKIREAALAVRLEQRYSKQEILTRYLNSLYLGNNLYGVQAAAKYYFGVPVKDLALDRKSGRREPLLALARASMLAGIAPAPSLWNPVKDYATARIRQQYTLNRMVVAGLASPQQVSDAYQLDVRPLRVRAPEAPTIAPEFTDEVKARVTSDLAADEKLNRGGLRVRTTLDLDLQQAFNDALREVLPDADDPQAAIVAIDYRTGDVKAMSTLRRRPPLIDGKGKVVRPEVKDYEQRIGFNLATQASRSTGSTIKPFTLAVALQQGMSLGTSRYASNCESIPNPSGRPNPYRFCNADKRESGRFSLRRAMADSVNTIYLPLANDVGRKKVFDLAVASGLKIDTDGGRRKPWGNLSFGIGGGVEVTPLSEAVSFGTFANDGRLVPSRFVSEMRVGATGSDPGEVFLTNDVRKPKRVMSKDVARDVVEALTDVVRHGTGTRARQPYTVFGKTGTTNSATDAWFTGCIPSQHLCIATWMGHEYITCTFALKGFGKVRVDGPCGGMKHGHRPVYGGTLPAEVFAKAQDNYQRIKAERAARAAGLPLPSLKPSPTKRAKPSPTPKATLTPKPSRSPKPKPTRSPTPPVVVPTIPSSPTSSPTPEPGPSP